MIATRCQTLLTKAFAHFFRYSFDNLQSVKNAEEMTASLQTVGSSDYTHEEPKNALRIQSPKLSRRFRKATGTPRHREFALAFTKPHLSLHSCGLRRTRYERTGGVTSLCIQSALGAPLQSNKWSSGFIHFGSE